MGLLMHPEVVMLLEAVIAFPPFLWLSAVIANHLKKQMELCSHHPTVGRPCSYEMASLRQWRSKPVWQTPPKPKELAPNQSHLLWVQAEPSKPHHLSTESI